MISTALAAAAGLLAAGGVASAATAGAAAPEAHRAGQSAQQVAPSDARHGKDCTSAPAKRVARTYILSPYGGPGWAEMMYGTSGECAGYKWTVNHIERQITTGSDDPAVFSIVDCPDMDGDGQCPGSPRGEYVYEVGPDQVVEPGTYTTGAIYGKDITRYGNVQCDETYGHIYYSNNQSDPGTFSG